ncbi:MAG: sensor domain-containing diguanylate cyclase [Eubacterium sp.]|nr:sensor domain-containing diguanylate cyclase [Eubacterium sp.]
MKIQRVIYTVYVIIAVMAFGYGIWTVFDRDVRTSGDLYAFGEGWKTSDGREVTLDDFPKLQEGEEIRLQNITPNVTSTDSVWNLVSHNIYFEVKINDVTMYTFYPEENITGKGYGDYVHRIVLRPPGSKVTLLARSIYGGESGGFFKDSYIGTTADFNHLVFREHGFPFILAMLIIIFGVLVLVMYFSSMGMKGANSSYHMPALGMGVLIGGIWSAVPTLVPHLVLNNQMIMRVIDYTCLATIGFPLVVFINSVTENKRRIYEVISFTVTAVCLTLLYGLRLIFGIDMHSINTLNLLSCSISLVIVLVIIVDDAIDHRKNERRTVNRALYVGTICFVIGASIDLIKYVSRGKKFIDNGIYMQVGFLIFILVMIMQAQRRMLMEHQVFDQQQFVNNLLKYSFSGQSPDVIINQMLTYLGEESGADRAYIFEDNYDGTFANTYEWCREGVRSEIDNLKKVPFSGAVQLWYDSYRETGSVYIPDIEAYRNESEKMYAILKPQGIRTLVTCPLEKEGGYIGFFGVDNPPANKSKEILQIIRLLGFFFVVIMRQRDTQEQLIQYSYVDSLTGIRNRRSLDEMRSSIEGSGNTYGLLMCDINGLKRMNDEQGHEAGDQMIVDVADCLKTVFGDRRVFRMGGDEFLVVREGGNREQFALAVREVRDMISKKGRSVSMGTAFSSEGFSFEALLHMADERMYDDKKRFYETNHEDRRKR